MQHIAADFLVKKGALSDINLDILYEVPLIWPFLLADVVDVEFVRS